MSESSKSDLPATETTALGIFAPSLVPFPAETSTTATVMLLAGQYLVEFGRSLFLVDLAGQRKL